MVCSEGTGGGSFGGPGGGCEGRTGAQTSHGYNVAICTKANHLSHRAHLAILLLILALAGLAACAHPRPGQRFVDEIEIHGNQQLRDVRIKLGLRTRETGWAPWAERRWLDRGALDRDLRRVVALYAANGFFLAKVVAHKVVKNDDGKTVDVHITVSEGPRAVISMVRVDGLTGLSGQDRQRVIDELRLTQGAPFVHRTYLRAKTSLLARLKQVGYAYAEVTGEARVRKGRRKVTVTLRARPGPLVRFGRCKFRGLGPIPAAKLKRLVAFSRGERYDARKLVRTRNALINTKVFADVRVELPEQAAAVADVTVTVRLARLREVRVGAGIGLEKDRHEAHLTAYWTWRNFLGGMRTLSAKLQPAFISMPLFWDNQNYGPGLKSYVRLTQPDWFGSGINLFGKIGYDVAVEDGYQSHGVQLKGGGERFFFGSMLRLGLSWNMQLFDLFNKDDDFQRYEAVVEPWIFKDPYRAIWLETYAMLDLRDDVMDPRAGFWAVTRLEQGLRYLGSDFTYFKVTPELRGYLPLGTKRVVLALRGLFGYLHPWSKDDSPLYRRYRLGGATSHRGFSSGRLSAQHEGLVPDPDTGKTVSAVFPAHGNLALLLSADLRLRLFKLGQSWLNLSLFADGGDSVLELDQLELDNLHWAVGGGLMYNTPIGVINVSLGVRLNRMAEKEANGVHNPDPGEDGIDRLALHIILGGAF